MALDVADWLERYRIAWENRDPDAAAALFTEDASYREEPYAQAFQGRAGVHDYWARVTATQSDVVFRYGEPLTQGDRAAAEWWTTMRNGGAEITLAGEFWLRFDADGLCSELREYWHFGEGHHEPPPGWGR
jgi:nuclear transport factor 2 (NTF2) superfamily protein